MQQLTHRNPTNHPTDWWDKVVKRIPKGSHLHEEQYAFVKQHLKSPVNRILDIGAGEGTFTETALIILQQAGKLASVVHLDVIEACEELWKMCERRLNKTKNLLASQSISLTFSRITKPLIIPRNQDELFVAFDQLHQEYNTYPLLIASHVTYYFHDGGVDFAYSLLTRLLANGGYAWFVVRDRNCPFYHLRKKLLIDKGVPDINTHQFSDSFINALKTLFTGVQSNKRDLELQLSDCSPKLRKQVIEYLTWLDGLSGEDIDGFMSNINSKPDSVKFPNLRFSEKHIWIYNDGQNISRQDEIKRLQAAHLLSHCLNSIWEIAPDAVFLAVSLAEIAPSVAAPEKDLRETQTCFVPEDYAKPMAFPGFNLVLYGFKNDPAAKTKKDPLNSYFKKHTSFLYYPRFYIDHVSVCPDNDNESYYHTVMPTRTGLAEQPEAYSIDAGNPQKIDIKPSILDNSTFSVALDHWAKLTGDYYISEATGRGLWTFAVGTHLLPSGGFTFDDDPQLNSRCALFLTVATACNFHRLSGYVVGHIKTNLTQYLAQKVYQVAQERLRKAEKAEQVMQLMQRPLNDLATAVDAMQRDTQKLKSILYEPSDALFSSYSRISHLFEQGRKVNLSAEMQVTINHLGEYEAPDELRAVVCYIICCFYGKEEKLKGAESFQALVLSAGSILTDVDSQSAFANITRGIKYLCDICKLEDITKMQDERYFTIYNTFKAAIFTPFKFESSVWPGIALALLFEIYPNAVKDIRDIDLTIKPEWTPVRFSSIISFLAKVHFEYQQRGTTTSCVVESVKLIKINEGGTIEVMFRGQPLFEELKGSSELVRQRIAQLLTVPRDWRIDHANVGDFMASFVTLATSLLGLGEAWTTQQVTGDELLRVVSHDRRRCFRLHIHDNRELFYSRLSLDWLPVAGMLQ